MLHTLRCELGHMDLSDYVVFAALCGLFYEQSCLCVCVFGGRWVLCFCPNQLAEMGYYGDSTCCARSGIRRFPQFSKCTLAYLH